MTPTLESCHYYLPITDELFHGGLYVTSAGHGTILPGQCYPVKQHPSLYQFDWSNGRVLPEFSFILITDGTGIFECEAMPQQKIEAGMVILLFPGVWHRYRPDLGTGWTEKWVQFNGEFPHMLINEGVITPDNPVLRIKDPAAVADCLDRLVDLVRLDPTSNSPHLSMLAMGALGLSIERQITEPPPTARIPGSACRDPLVVAAIEYVWTRSHKVLSVADVAEAVGSNRRTLERRIKAVTGHSTLDEISLCRLSRAERLLRETELPIKAVVELAGFGSDESMRMAFMKRSGVSPAWYRAKYRNGGVSQIGE